MITSACPDTKNFVEENNDYNSNVNRLPFIDRNQFSGFEKVLFNKQLINLIHCPVVVRGE